VVKLMFAARVMLFWRWISPPPWDATVFGPTPSAPELVTVSTENGWVFGAGSVTLPVKRLLPLRVTLAGRAVAPPMVLLGICFWREAPETAVGADRRAGKWGLRGERGLREKLKR
jgi:hypothetical protein